MLLRELPACWNLYGLPVYLDESLTWEPVLLLPAGSHREVIEMRYEDYDRAVHPIIGHYVPELKRAGGA